MGEHDFYIDYNPDGTYAKSVTELAAMAAEQMQALVAAPELPEVSVLRMQPGDTLVVRLKRCLSDAELEEVTDRLKTQFPETPVCIFDGGTDLVVLRKDGA